MATQSVACVGRGRARGRQPSLRCRCARWAGVAGRAETKGLLKTRRPFVFSRARSASSRVSYSTKQYPLRDRGVSASPSPLLLAAAGCGPHAQRRAASTLSVCTRAPWLAALGASDMPQVVTAGELAVVAHELEDVPFCHARVHVSQIQAAVRLAHRLPRGPASTLARQRRPRTPHRTHGAAHTRERETMAGARSTQGSVLRAGSPQPRPRAPRTFSACTVPIGPREKGAPLPCDSPPRPPRPAIPFLFRRKSSI